jgi:hypothetical protein
VAAGRSSSDLRSQCGDVHSTSPLGVLAEVPSLDGEDLVSFSGDTGATEDSTTSPIQHDTGRVLSSHSPVLPFDERRLWAAPSPQSSFNLQYSDAIHLQHFTAELGRWLDCTDAARQFTTKIPRLAQEEEILLRAVVCFAARHMRQPEAAAQAHEQCVRLLIPRLTAADVASDDAVLCSIVILRVFEQLDGKCAAEPHEARSSLTDPL